MVQGKPGTMALMAWNGKDWGIDASIVKLFKTAGGMSCFNPKACTLQILT